MESSAHHASADADGELEGAAGPDPLIGYKLDGRYTLEELIGEGETGRVYRARQEATGREVAVKLLRESLVTDEDSVRRFRREAKAACRINHPNTITVHDCGCTADGKCYLVTELIEGETLRALLDREGLLPPDLAIALFEQILGGMQAAHERGVVHRDLHPGNIFVSAGDHGEPRVKIFDFGGARLMDPGMDADITGTNHLDLRLLLASIRYLAPERMQRDFRPDPRCDVYSLGLILFELCTGQHPFDSEDPLQMMAMHLREPPPLLSAWAKERWFSPALQGLVTSMLAKDPALRPADAHEVEQRLASAQERDGLIALRDVVPEPEVEIEMIALPADEDLERRATQPLLPALSDDSETSTIITGVREAPRSGERRAQISGPPRDRDAERPVHAALHAVAPPQAPPGQVPVRAGLLDDTVLDLSPAGVARVRAVQPEPASAVGIQAQPGDHESRGRVLLAFLCLMLGAVVMFSLGTLGYRGYQRWHTPAAQLAVPTEEPPPAPLRP